MPICKIHGKAGKGKGRSLKVRKSLKCWSVTEIRWNSKTCLCVIAGAIRTSAKTIHELASWMPHVSAGILLKFFFLCRRITSTAALPSRCVAKCGGTCHVHRCSHTEQATLLVLPIVACNQQDTLSTLYEMRRSELQLGFFFATIGLFIHVTNERPNEFCHPRFGLQTGRRNWHIHQTYRVSYKSPEQINLALSRLTVYEWITTAMLKNDFLEDVGYNEINDAFISYCKNEDIQQRSTNTNHCYYSIQSNPIQLDLNPVGLRNTK